MILAIVLAIVTVMAGGLLYVITLYPFQAVLQAMGEAFPESNTILGNLNTIYLWAPVFLILLPIFVYLIVKAMEERVRGDVYYP